MLAHWNNRTRIEMSLHSGTLSWFRANQSFPYEPSGEATITNFIVFGLTLSELWPTICHTRGGHTNHYTTHAVKQSRSKSYQITCTESTFRHTNSISKFRSSLWSVVTSRLLNWPLHTLSVTMMSSTISIIWCWEKSDSGFDSSV